jgi:cell filamentation protein
MEACSYPEHIDREMEKLIDTLAKAKFFKDTSTEEFAKLSAHFLAELNAIHPFREGNGRTQLIFLALLAERAGHVLNLGRLDPEAIMQAVIESFGGMEEPLAKLVL